MPASASRRPSRLLSHLHLPGLLFVRLCALVFAVVLAASSTASAAVVTVDDPPEKPLLAPEPAVPGALRLSWFGRSGFTYFIQQTRDLSDLSWQYLPIIETGEDASLSYVFGSVPQPAFFARLRIADQTAEDPLTADFDGDGIGNMDELLHFLDPLDAADSDGDGFPDDWERFYLGGTATAGSRTADQNGDGITDWEAWLLGLNPTGQASDRNPPQWTADATLSGSSGTVLMTLNWPAAVDPEGGAVSYVLYRNGVPQGASITATSHETDISDLVGWQRWHVRPVDAAGNHGAPTSLLELQLGTILDVPFEPIARSVSASRSYWGYSRSDPEKGTRYFQTQTNAWSWTLTKEERRNYDWDVIVASTETYTGSGSLTTVSTKRQDDTTSSTSSGAASGTYTYNTRDFGDERFISYSGTYDAAGRFSGEQTDTFYYQDGSETTNYEQVESPKRRVSADRRVSSSPTVDVYENSNDNYTIGTPGPNQPVTEYVMSATRTVTYSDELTPSRMKELLRASLPPLDSLSWGDGDACAVQQQIGGAFDLAESQYRVRLEQTSPEYRYRTRWLEVFYPKSGTGTMRALAARSVLIAGTGGVAESDVYSLSVPDELEGSICPVPITLSLSVPSVLPVNEDFDERVETVEGTPWTSDAETPSPLRADGKFAADDLAAIWIGSNGDTTKAYREDRFGPETSGVRLSVTEGAECVRLHALAPKSGSSPIYGPGDWIMLDGGEELWGICFGLQTEGGYKLPDWTLYIEGLQPGKAVVRLEVDRYGYTLVEERTVFVTRVELVERDRASGEVRPVSGPAYGSTPFPEVELRVESATLSDQQTMELRVSGTVRDALSEVLDAPEDRLAGLLFYVNGEAVDGLGDLPSLAGDPVGTRPWQPRRFEVNFTRTLTIPVSGPGSIRVQARTTPNAAGQRGWAEALIHLGRPASGNPPPPLTPALFRWSAAPGAGTIDQVRVRLGTTTPAETDPVLVETGANTGVFTGWMQIDGEARSANLELALPAADAPWSDRIDGRLIYPDAEGRPIRLLGSWERQAGDDLLYRFTRTFPRDDVPPPLAIVGTSELGGTREETFSSMVLRIDGLQEADDNHLPADLLLDGDGIEATHAELRPFVFSPEYLYLVNPNKPGYPALLVASSPILYGQEEPVKVLKAGRQNFTLVMPNRPAIEGTSVHVAQQDSPCEPPEGGPSRAITFDEVMFWYEFLFKRSELPQTKGKSTPLYLRDTFTAANCAYEMVGGTEVTGSYLMNFPSRLLIQIGEDTDPLTAAAGLLEAYESLYHTAPVWERLVDDGADAVDLLAQRNAAAKQAIAPLREFGLAVMEAQFAFLNEGADVAMSIQEVADGNMYAAIGIIPGIPTSVNKVIIGTAVGGIAQEALKGPVLDGFKAYLSEVTPLLRNSKRFSDRVLNAAGARARLTFLNNCGHLLSRNQLHIMYNKLSVLRSDKNRNVLADQLAKNGFPKPGDKFAPHHDLPLEFEEDFILAGMDPNNHLYGRWIPNIIHDKWSNAPGFLSGGPFNEVWRDFLRDEFKNSIPRTKAEILTKLAEIRAMPEFKYP